MTLRKPLGLILDSNGQGDVYVKEIVKGGNAEMLLRTREALAEFCHALLSSNEFLYLH